MANKTDSPITLKHLILGYGINNIDEYSPTVTYIGKEGINTIWIIQKMDTSLGTVIAYATPKNNSSINDYDDAWEHRTTLTYGRYSEAF